MVAFIASVDVPAHWRIPLLIKMPYLSVQGEEAIALPFSKVEELTGKPLCKSAYKYASY